MLAPVLFLFLQPQGPAADPQDPAAEIPRLAYRRAEGLRSPVLYKLILATVIGNPMVIGIMIHVIPITSTTGLTVKQAALVPPGASACPASSARFSWEC